MYKNIVTQLQDKLTNSNDIYKILMKASEYIKNRICVLKGEFLLNKLQKYLVTKNNLYNYDNRLLL